MKPRHWLNLIGVSLVAGVLALLAARWATSAYAEPTCRRFATANHLTFVRYSFPSMSYQGTSALDNDGDCHFARADGTDRVVGLYTASGTSGAPLLVSFALRPDLIFMFSFFVVALALALVMRAIGGMKPTDPLPR